MRMESGCVGYRGDVFGEGSINRGMGYLSDEEPVLSPYIGEVVEINIPPIE